MRYLLLSLLTISSITAKAQLTLWTKDSSDLKLSGYVDAYFSYNLNKPSDHKNTGTTGAGRIFDVYHQQFVLHTVQTKWAYSNQNLKIVSDLIFGPGAELSNFNNFGSSFAIKQAYLSYGLSDKLSFTVGQYSTHIGYELLDAVDNFNYSASYQFGNGPFYHTGAKFDYQLTDMLGLMGGVVNGWDNLLDNNKALAITAQLRLEPSEQVAIYLNWSGGDEDPLSVTGDTLNSYKHISDITATFALTEKLNAGINASYGWYNFDTMSTQNWGGAALYVDYSLSEKLGIGARIEYFDDVAAVQNLGAAYIGYTLTTRIALADEHLLIKPELRYDESNQSIYLKENGSTASSQTTIGVAFLGRF